MLTEAEQLRRREWMRDHWQNGVVLNHRCGMTVERWDEQGVEIRLPYDDGFTANDGYLHGGMLATLIDAAGCGAVAAGHDYNNGSRVTTVSMSVQYLSFAQREAVIARASCTKRGRMLQFAEVDVMTAAGRLVARGVLTITVT
jgi:uncharacterized protein (TIGR00369 family)